MNKILISIVVVFVLIQLIPVDHDNPSTEINNEIVLPDSVKNLLQNSCFDCHSHNTSWPWYSYVAPASWIVAYHVHQGREELNFSQWNTYNLKRKQNKLKDILEEIEDNEMPLPMYLVMHQGAKLSDSQKTLLTNWVLSQNMNDEADTSD